MPMATPPRVLAIRLENFMSFKDSGWIELRDLSLLYGRNSVGKSAIIRALLMLKLSVGVTSVDPPLRFHVGDLLDLGSFENVVHNFDRTAKIGIGFRIEIKSNVAYGDDSRPTFVSELSELSGQISQGEIFLQYGFDPNRQSNLMIEALKITVQDYELVANHSTQWWRPKLAPTTIIEWPVAAEIPFRSDIDLVPRWYYQSESDPESSGKVAERKLALESLKSNFWKDLIPCRRDGFIRLFAAPGDFDVSQSRNDNPDFESLDRWMQYFQDTIYNFLRSITYLEPLRNSPKRYYYVPQSSNASVNTIDDAFLITHLSDQNNVANIRLWLEEIELEATVELENIRDGLYAIRLRNINSTESLSVNLRDIGFGVSQALPIILASFVLPENGMLMIEQPEVHLHPKAQGALADIFVNQVAQGRKFLIETHSEHLLLRIQRRIAENRLIWLDTNEDDFALDFTSDQFNLIFVERQGNQSNVQSIFSDEYGQLLEDEAPKEFLEFFDQAYRDVTEITIVASRARILAEQRDVNSN